MQFSLFDEVSTDNSTSADTQHTALFNSVAALQAQVDLPALAGQLQSIDLIDGQLYMLPRWLGSELASYLLAQLSAELAWQQSEIKLYGKRRKIPRLNAWYGDANAHYQYSGLPLAPLAWTAGLSELRQALDATVLQLAGLLGDSLGSATAGSAGLLHYRPGHFNSVLANLYRDERDSVAWHSDDEPELGRRPLIASVSLGQARYFSLKHKSLAGERHRLLLPPGSLLIMSGATQQHWRHAVLKQAAAAGPRLNLTFRRVVSKG